VQDSTADYDQAVKRCLFWPTIVTATIIEAVVEAQSDFRIDSLSGVYTMPKSCRIGSEKNKYYAAHLFYLAFENQNVDDYITEKIVGPFEAGVDVYLGAGVLTCRRILSLPCKTLRRFRWRPICRWPYEDLYEEYQQWRKIRLPAKFHTKYDFTHIHSTCHYLSPGLRQIVQLGVESCRNQV
jgi:hypothetical protein